MNRPPFPEVIDNSLMSAWRACPRKCELEYFHHWKPKDPSVHLHAGASFASGLEAARRAFFEAGLSPDDSIAIGVGALLSHYGMFDCPEDSPKSATRMAGALVYHFDEYPLQNELAVPITLPGGKRGIEFSFAEPIDILHPDTGNPLLYVGRMDQIVHFAGGIFGEDDKTTSQLGASWPNQWDLRSQFTGYCWGAARAGFPLAGFLIRGTSILKTKYDHAQAVTYRAPWQIDQWYEQLLRDLARMIQAWESGYFDYNLDEACNSFGGCMFRTPCRSEDPLPWLETGFERRRWDPVTRTETLL